MAKARKKKPKNATQYPTEVVKLARAFKVGKDCGFALHDTLLECGLPGPASHLTGDKPCQPGHTCLVVEEILNPRKPEDEDSIWEWGDGAKKPTSNRFTDAGKDLSEDFLTVCRDLEAHGVAWVEIEYDGYGDSGAIEGITLFDRTCAEIPIAKLSKLRYPYGGDSKDTMTIREKLEDLGDAILPGGWENGGGACGTIDINTVTRRVRVNHVWRVEDTEEAPYEFEF